MGGCSRVESRRFPRRHIEIGDVEFEWLGRARVSSDVHIATANVDKGLTGTVAMCRARLVGHRQRHGPRLHHHHRGSWMRMPTRVAVGARA